jgi:hypothetical protein
MFSKNSRYRNLPESSPVDARGERPLGKELRVIPRPAGRFLYTVHDADRLDLLAFKYYGDPTKWWQICDANPEQPFPLDLLDTHPLVTERFALGHPSFELRFDALLNDLKALGQVKVPDAGDPSNPSRRSPFGSLLVVTYTTSLATRGQIVAALGARGFDFVGADGWPAGQQKYVEAFAFDDPAARLGWASMTRALAGRQGVARVHSAVMEGTLELTYNGSVVTRAALVAALGAHGFTPTREPETLSRVGARIVLPPDRPA